jgi:hypothetical protein
MKEKEKIPRDIKKLLPLILLFLLLLALLVYLRLGNMEDTSQDSLDAKRTTDQIEITNYDDTLPVNYPEDLPEYGNAEIVSASESDSSVSVMWRTGDLVEDVKNYYDLALKENDWEFELTETDETVMYKIGKNEKRGFLVIAVENGMTTITIAVGLE